MGQGARRAALMGYTEMFPSCAGRTRPWQEPTQEPTQMTWPELFPQAATAFERTGDTKDAPQHADEQISYERMGSNS